MFNGGGAVKAGENRRESFARYITADPQFSRAHVNYLWEKLMVEALVSPSNTFDLARISPNAQMPDGWTLQPANAQLLQALSDDFAANGFNFRRTVELVVKSNAYQLSSAYPGEWNIGFVPYYARKFVRRLEGEEIHDSLVMVTNIPPTMADPDNGNRVRVGYRMLTDDNVTTGSWIEWAGQMPEPAEPRSNGNRVFVQSFLTGDRDQKFRSAEPSILQALNMMNNTFVRNRVLQGTTAAVTFPENKTYISYVRELVVGTTLTYDQIAERLYLRTLSRKPTDAEWVKLRAYYTKQTKQQFAENLQWVLFNKVDFIFNY
jgi:O6-methylguanine-DNA--protein-cysteine methyltransferase